MRRKFSSLKSMISVNKSYIEIQARHFGTSFTYYHKELLCDLIGNYYSGQKIFVYATDGENLEVVGFLDFLESLCNQFDIPKSSIIIKTFGMYTNREFTHQPIPLHIFEDRSAVNGIYERDSQSKFVGCTIRRFNPTRLRLVFELDQAFPNDSFLIFHPPYETVKKFYENISGAYANELLWLEKKKFDLDLSFPQNSVNGILFTDAITSYKNIWNKFDIEVVSETDAFGNRWFTEKTSRCLATGKPFVLLSGEHSLKILQDKGYQTFGSVIDESYDKEKVLSKRISAIISSLKELYLSSDKHQRINQLYSIAKQNINV